MASFRAVAADRTVAAFGTWPSPFEAAQVASSAIGISSLIADGDDLYWLEARPDEGCQVLVKWTRSCGQEPREVSPRSWDVRSRVHEYGGGAVTVRAGAVLAVSGLDQLPYRLDGDGAPIAASPPAPPGESWRFADGDIVAGGPLKAGWCEGENGTGLASVWVRECHRHDSVENHLVGLILIEDRPRVGSDAGPLCVEPIVLARGHDFYAAPRVDPLGRYLAWITWDRPDMPWDATSLWVAELELGCELGKPSMHLGPPMLAAGGPAEHVSVLQPRWARDGSLWFVGDRSGWWNLARISRESLDRAVQQASSTSVLARGPLKVAEIDDTAVAVRTPLPALVAHELPSRSKEAARPPWQLGQSTYCFLADGSVACSYAQGGRDYLEIVHLDSAGLVAMPERSDEKDQSPQIVRLPCLPQVWHQCPWLAAGPGSAASEVGAGSLVSIPCVAATRESIACIAATPLQGQGIWVLEPDGSARCIRAGSMAPEGAAVALAQAFAVLSTGGEEIHALAYDPASSTHRGPPEQRPPLLILCHGGPTACATMGYDPIIQFWTSRGFAVVAVNYRGSSGYGRAYRDALRGKWGVMDVSDCLEVAARLVELGKVDPEAILVRGSSAGGFTALSILSCSSHVAAGAVYYAVTDLEALATDTHKFESSYLEGLLGPYPEERERYVDRSPACHPERIRAPVIIFQGLDDIVVPPTQTMKLAEALERMGVMHKVIGLPGEGHGFRHASTRERCLGEELEFYTAVLGL